MCSSFPRNPCKLTCLETGLPGGPASLHTEPLLGSLGAGPCVSAPLQEAHSGTSSSFSLSSVFKLIPGFRGHQSDSSITNSPTSLSLEGLSSHWGTFFRDIIWDRKNGDILMLSFSLHLLPGTVLLKKKPLERIESRVLKSCLHTHVAHREVGAARVSTWGGRTNPAQSVPTREHDPASERKGPGLLP